jgi:hypothetical protein
MGMHHHGSEGDKGGNGDGHTHRRWVHMYMDVIYMYTDIHIYISSDMYT